MVPNISTVFKLSPDQFGGTVDSVTRNYNDPFMCTVFPFCKEERKYNVKAGKGMVRVVSPDRDSVITLQQLSFPFNLTLSEPPAGGRGIPRSVSVGTGCLQRGRTSKHPVLNSTVYELECV